MTIPDAMTPAAKKVLEEAVRSKRAGGMADGSRLLRAVEEYEAAQLPKDCRPPDGAKEFSYWHLTNPHDEHIVALWQNGAWDFTGSSESVSPGELSGWTVHSECVFPGERSITDEQIAGCWKGNYGIPLSIVIDFARAIIAEVGGEK